MWRVRVAGGLLAAVGVASEVGAAERAVFEALTPAESHESCLFDDEAAFIAKLRTLLLGPPPDAGPFRASAARFAWPAVISQWDAALERLCNSARL